MFDPVNYEGNKVANAVASLTRSTAENLVPQIKDLESAYWMLSAQLKETAYSDPNDQLTAMRRLGQLAEAIAALKEAKTVCVHAGCWLKGRNA